MLVAKTAQSLIATGQDQTQVVLLRVEVIVKDLAATKDGCAVIER